MEWIGLNEIKPETFFLSGTAKIILKIFFSCKEKDLVFKSKHPFFFMRINQDPE